MCIKCCQIKLLHIWQWVEVRYKRKTSATAAVRWRYFFLKYDKNIIHITRHSSALPLFLSFLCCLHLNLNSLVRRFLNELMRSAECGYEKSLQYLTNRKINPFYKNIWRFSFCLFLVCTCETRKHLIQFCMSGWLP